MRLYCKLTYFCVVDQPWLSSVEFLEKDICVRVRQHELPGEIISCDVVVMLSLIVYGAEEIECLLDVKLWILEQQLPLLLDYHLCPKQLVP